MTRLIRTFHPVGQGAFYTERFIIDENNRSKDINVVYDCGSFNWAALHRAIDAEFHQGETIHAVFISHFHYDHISGLDYLRKRCKIQRLYFPDVAKEFRLCFLMDCLIDTKDRREFEYDFIKDPSTINRSETNGGDTDIKLYAVQIASNDDNLSESPERMIGRYNDDGYRESVNGICKIRSGTGIVSVCGYGGNDWIYIPFNLPHNDGLQRVKNILGGKTCEELQKIIIDGGDDYKRLKKAYFKEFPSNMRNEMSMTLYSGFTNFRQKVWFDEICSTCNCRLWHPHPCLCMHGEISPGCLYTGDYPANLGNNLTELCKAFKLNVYKEGIKYLQVPHHGSINGFNIGLLSYGARRLIISAGTENRFGHPSMEVIEKLIMEGRQFSIVSECLNSMFISEFIIQ